jgi:hypothetical protein
MATKGKQNRSFGQGQIVGKRPQAQMLANMALLGVWGRAERTAALPGALPYPLRPAASREAERGGADPLGAPLDLRAVAKLIGCSPWTVRQNLIPKGLPVFRSGASGKLIFYTNQVVRWIHQKQQGGY